MAQSVFKKDRGFSNVQKRNQAKRKRINLFYIILFLVISVVFLVICSAVFLKVKSVSINGCEKYSYEQIMEYVNIKEGENIYSFDKEQVENAILNNFPYIKSVEIKRDLPTTVEINIEEEKVYFASELAGDTYLMSSELKVLERLTDTKSTQTDYVALSLNNVRECIVGDSVKFVNNRTLDAITELYDNLEYNAITHKIKSVDVRSRFDIYVNYEDRLEIYLGDSDDMDTKISFLVSIVDQLETDAKGEIDISNPREASVILN